MKILQAIAFVAILFGTFYYTASQGGLNFNGATFPWLALLEVALASLLGIFGGCLFRRLVRQTGQVNISSEVVAVVNSSSFWSAICVSPMVFGATFVAMGSSPGDASSLLLA